MDEQIFAGAFINWKRNFDPESGKPIVEENDSAYDAFYKKMMYLVGEGFAPVRRKRYGRRELVTSFKASSIRTRCPQWLGN